MSTAKRKRGGIPTAAAEATSVSPAVATAASTSAAGGGSFHAHTAHSAASASTGNNNLRSANAVAKQITPSPNKRGERVDRQQMRSSNSDDDSSKSASYDASEAGANSANPSASVGYQHANDGGSSGNFDCVVAIDRAGVVFSSSSSSASSSEDDDDDPITKEIMQILEEEVRRGQESEGEVEQDGLESEDDADGENDFVADADVAVGTSSSPTFEVERILARRYNCQRKRKEYLLAWMGCADDPAEYSWEPHDHLDSRAKGHVEERWGERPSGEMEINDQDLDGPRVARYRLWQTKQLSALHRRQRKPQQKKKKNGQEHQSVARREALPASCAQSPIVASGRITPERPLVPTARPLVAERETIEILWKGGIQPFMLPNDKWEVVDDWNLLTVYEWRGEEGSVGGLCCVGYHPHRDFPVQTAWRIISRQGRRGRSTINRLTPDFSNFCRTSDKRSNAASLQMAQSIPPPRSAGAKRKRKTLGVPTSEGVKLGRSSGSAIPDTGTSRRGQGSRGNGARTTKAAASFTANSEYVGSRVARDFYGALHFGTVKKYLSYVSALWAIQFDDGDTEDMNKRELERAIELYERKKSEDVESRTTSEEVEEGWEFGDDDGELDHDLSQSLQEPIGLPQVALERTIEFLWEKGVFPFNYAKNKVEVVDDWSDYQIFDWKEGSGGGTAIVSYKSHPKVKVRVKWRPVEGRRRRKPNFLKPSTLVEKTTCTKRPSRVQAQARRHHGRAKKSMITMLELFSGSGVLSDAFRRKGIQCVTLDNDPKWSRNGNHHCMTIAQLRKHIEDGAVPEGLDQERDIVFAAPCCTTFSRASCGRHRNAMNIDGHSPESQAANKMIEDLIFVLTYYRRLNPQCLIVIENPEGYLQMTPFANMFENELNLKMVTLSYCMLSDKTALPRKHTCLWTNSTNLHHLCRNDAYKCRHDCHVRDGNGRRHQKHVQDKDDRFASYPEEFNVFVRDHLLADVRAEQCGDMSASNSTTSSSECDD